MRALDQFGFGLQKDEFRWDFSNCEVKIFVFNRIQKYDWECPLYKQLTART
jgi:hypothetical protein